MLFLTGCRIKGDELVPDSCDMLVLSDITHAVQPQNGFMAVARHDTNCRVPIVLGHGCFLRFAFKDRHNNSKSSACL